jgi:hypothetical protein
MGAAALACFALAACDQREQTVTENLVESPDAGGAAEVGRPSEVNAAMGAEGANATTNPGQ